MLVGGLAGVGVVLVAAIAVTRVGRTPDEARVNVVSGHPTETPQAVSRNDAALAFIRQHDHMGGTHVRRLVWSGPMLRVYTDLPKSAANSRTAITLCRVAAAYLVASDQSPGVFVHARSRDGYQVLANKMNTRDGCRLNDVP